MSSSNYERQKESGQIYIRQKLGTLLHTEKLAKQKIVNLAYRYKNKTDNDHSTI